MAVVWVSGVAALDVGSREAKKASWLVSGPGLSLSTPLCAPQRHLRLWEVLGWDAGLVAEGEH